MFAGFTQASIVNSFVAFNPFVSLSAGAMEEIIVEELIERPPETLLTFVRSGIHKLRAVPDPDTSQTTCPEFSSNVYKAKRPLSARPDGGGTSGSSSGRFSPSNIAQSAPTLFGFES